MLEGDGARQTLAAAAAGVFHGSGGGAAEEGEGEGEGEAQPSSPEGSPEVTDAEEEEGEGGGGGEGEGVLAKSGAAPIQVMSPHLDFALRQQQCPDLSGFRTESEGGPGLGFRSLRVSGTGVQEYGSLLRKTPGPLPAEDASLLLYPGDNPGANR